jgi:AAHS family 4-hydroxybenzoate transporter-like MFS transporter
VHHFPLRKFWLLLPLQQLPIRLQCKNVVMRLAALSRTPFFLVLVAFMLVMIDGYDMFIVSFVAPLIAHDLHLAAGDLGAVFAAGLAGSALGGLVLGPCADRYGRQRVLIASLAAAGIATLLCSRANSFEAFASLRFLTGFALGGILAAVVPLIAEYFPAEHRSRAVTSMFIGYPLGAVVGGIITAILLAHGWRSLFVGTGTVTLLMLPLAFLMRETLGLRHDNEQGERPAQPRLSIAELFTEGRLWTTLTTSFGIFCLLLLTYLLNSWTPLIAVRLGFKPQTAALCGVFLNLGGVVGALSSMLWVRRYGVFRIAALMTGVGSLGIALIGVAAHSAASLFLALFISGVLVIGAQQNSPAMAVQLYPRRMRAAGAGWQFAAGRCGSILGPIIGGLLLSSGITYEALFLLLAAPALVAGGAYARVDYLLRSRHPLASTSH